MPRFRPLLAALAAAAALTLLPAAGTLPLGVATAQAQSATVNIDVFFSPLASHGVWVKHPQYHYVFCPKVEANWQPYSHGHWLYTKSWGWYFASDEPFAWAVYHYGRWFHDQKVGWCWVPGNAWAGAWVAWRRSNDYVGWAPLGPDRDGYAVDVDISKTEPPKENWVFVPPKRFLAPQLNIEVKFGNQQDDAFQKTQFLGPVVVQNNIVVNNVIDINFIQQQTNTTVNVVDPKPVNDPSQAAADQTNNTIAVFAPQIAPPKQDEAPKQSVDEDQAQQQLANPSASSEQPSSAPPSSGESSLMASSSMAPSQQPSSAAPSSSAAPAPASSSEAASSAAPASSSSEQPAASSAASSAPPPAVTSSSEAPKASSSEAPAPKASSSEAPKPKASSSQEPVAAPASSSEAPKAKAASSEQPAASSEQPKASSEAPKATPPKEKPKPTECFKGTELKDGKCVPLEAPAQKTAPASSAAPAQ